MDVGQGWALLVLLGMIVTFRALASDNHEFEHYAYRTLWFWVGAVGFGHTALSEGGKKRVAYATLAIANGVAAHLLYVDYETMKPFAFGLAAVLQGVPLFVHAKTA